MKESEAIETSEPISTAQKLKEIRRKRLRAYIRESVQLLIEENKVLEARKGKRLIIAKELRKR